MMSEEEEEEEDEDGEDDLTNSGSHVNDALNQRDAMGGVLVNVGHPPNESDIYLAPQLAAVVKPHQVGNFHILVSNAIFSR
jgi:RAD54-like protein 2